MPKSIIDTLDWSKLSNNNSPAAIKLLMDHPDKIDWQQLVWNKNPASTELMLAYPDRVDWKFLSKYGYHDHSMFVLRAHPGRIDWGSLSYNWSDDAIVLLKANPDKIDWNQLSKNTNPEAIAMIQAHLKHEALRNQHKKALRVDDPPMATPCVDLSPIYNPYRPARHDDSRLKRVVKFMFK